MYYLRTRPAANAIQFTVDKSRLQAKNKTSPASRRDLFAAVAGKSAADNEAALLCSLENKENCLMCSGWTCTFHVRNRRMLWAAAGILCQTWSEYMDSVWLLIHYYYLWTAAVVFMTFLYFVCVCVSRLNKPCWHLGLQKFSLLVNKPLYVLWKKRDNWKGGTNKYHELSTLSKPFWNFFTARTIVCFQVKPMQTYWDVSAAYSDVLSHGWGHRDDLRRPVNCSRSTQLFEWTEQ